MVVADHAVFAEALALAIDDAAFDVLRGRGRRRRAGAPPGRSHEPRCGRHQPGSRRRGRLQDHPGAPRGATDAACPAPHRAEPEPPSGARCRGGRRRGRVPQDDEPRGRGRRHPPPLRSPLHDRPSDDHRAVRDPMYQVNTRERTHRRVPRPTTTGPRISSPGASGTSSPCSTVGSTCPRPRTGSASRSTRPGAMSRTSTASSTSTARSSCWPSPETRACWTRPPAERLRGIAGTASRSTVVPTISSVLTASSQAQPAAS